eukprot:TRINITY_DN121647_c0_g1_i1.p2 TRINITY_DN121647_c0_g1~~TRINITY_DN121647_c0_g1_i1.p2  ORF type:complete len:275 (-),score=99.72 TRINITY_DN121647_c0_g1_i1:176-1000(-)
MDVEAASLFGLPAPSAERDAEAVGNAGNASKATSGKGSGSSKKAKHSVTKEEVGEEAEVHEPPKPSSRKKIDKRPPASEDIIEQIAMFTLMNTTAINMVRSAVTEVIVLPASCCLAIATKSATKEFHDLTKGLMAKEKAKLGPPHIRTWQAVVQCVYKQAQDLKDTHTVKPIEDFVNLVKKFETEKKRFDFLTEVVRACRVSVCYGGETVKLEVAVHPFATISSEINNVQPAWVAIQKFLVKHMKGERKVGTAPPGSIERLLKKKFAIKQATPA